MVCFALGTWVGGMYTTDCCRYLAARGYPITVVTPGNNKNEILRVVQRLGSQFEQVVLLVVHGGVTPRDVVNEAKSQLLQVGARIAGASDP